MLGTVAAGWSYVACEPNRETYENLSKLIDFLDISNSVTLHNIPAEKFTYDQKVDIVLTSPPYFNLEIYTRDLDQSYHRYLEYEIWNEKWFRPLIENSMSMLNENGLSCWNVMNFGKQDLVETVIDVHVKNNYRYLDRVGFTSPLANIRNLKNKDVTYIYQRI
jgi:16S rRNA G966 N2-methylase RsmD